MQLPALTDAIALLPWAAPAAFLAGALLAAPVRAAHWPVLAGATRAALALSLVTAATVLFARAGHPQAARSIPAALTGALVGFLGWVIGRYARQYLQGEPGQRRFAVAYLATLAAVSTILASNHLGVIIAAWIACSAGLHHLLTFYPDRPAARVVAHKKFLASRAAEACLVIAAALLFIEWGTLDLDAVNFAARSGELPGAVAAAAVLIAMAALLKCAQMPLHGWLIQVMEAPTPVSALLHAGVVNLGGYLMIRLAPLLDAAPAARALLVVVGSLTAVGAGLVMMTRVTIKVRLAWSTCSQMGFMLLECGLGLYDLALLHLLAHSLYKACAFLGAGDAVRDSLALSMARDARRDAAAPALWPALLAAPAAWAVVMLVSEAWHQALGLPRVPVMGATLPAFGLATLLWQVRAAPTALVAGAAGIAQLYLGWHWLLSSLLRMQPAEVPAVLATWVLACFALLYVAQVLISTGRLPTDSPWYRRAYAGFYLDERFTRLAFTLWPRPAAERPARAYHLEDAR